MERRYYVTRDGDVVSDGDARAAQLIYVEGQELDDDRMAEFGADVPKQLRAMVKAHAAAESEPEVEEKAVASGEVQDKEAPRPRRNG